MTSQQKFEAIRVKYLAADAALEGIKYDLGRRYGSRFYLHGLTRTEEKKLAAARAKCDKLRDQFYSLLDTISPRNFRPGFPTHWIMTELSYDDAVTAGPMSVVPPPSYGYYPSDMTRLSSAVA